MNLISGIFQYMENGHLYFMAKNNSPIPIVVTIVATSVDGRQNSESVQVNPFGGFILGPTTPWQWYWQNGDTIKVIYPDMTSSVWTCNSLRQSAISFRGKCCSGTVGCSCSGFQPKTDGKVWEEAYCKKCGHHRRCHKY